jgi:hypothetical protein
MRDHARRRSAGVVRRREDEHGPEKFISRASRCICFERKALALIMARSLVRIHPDYSNRV